MSHLNLEVFDETVGKSDRQKKILEWKAEAALFYD